MTADLYIGVSPSGKALDSDSSISGVRIPAPQPDYFKFELAVFCVYRRLVRYRDNAVIIISTQDARVECPLRAFWCLFRQIKSPYTSSVLVDNMVWTKSA